MKSRDEFVKRWMRELVGGFMLGSCSDINDGPLTKAGKIMEIPKEVERLLGMMYDHVAEEPKVEPIAPKQAINGNGQHKPTFAGVTR